MNASKEQASARAKKEPRANHFVPQCWLAGFTETGQKDGRLWVTDLKRQKQWPSSPINTGHRRDFYRVSDEGIDPSGAEKMFSKIEDAVGPILKRLDSGQCGPRKDELEHLLLFMAIQWVRVPAFRPTLLAIADSFHRSKISEALESPASWTKMLKEAGISADDPAADYERMRVFEQSGEYTLSAEAGWYLLRGLQGTKTIFARLKERRWGTCLSQKGSFIGSDNPVAMDGPKGCKIGFKNAEIITYPVSRHVFLHGTHVPVKTPFVNQMFIAHKNTFVMLAADEQVYSAVPDFCWLDARGKYQTDWTLFSRKDYE